MRLGAARHEQVAHEMACFGLQVAYVENRIAAFAAVVAAEPDVAQSLPVFSATQAC